MKKKISSKLTLGKRSIASLSNQDMSIIDGGGGSYASGITNCGATQTCWAECTPKTGCMDSCGCKNTITSNIP